MAGILKSAKRSVLQLARVGGMFRRVASSDWRRNRLLILCYHGISLEDEHEWNRELYMSPGELDRRLSIIRETSCSVLPLAEAVQRLYSESLPERSVAITFDDGTYDFYKKAVPLLQKHGFPATVYLTTFYSEYPRPVYRLTCSYMLWKRRDRKVKISDVAGLNDTFDLSSPSTRMRVIDTLAEYADRHHLSADEKDVILGRLAAQIDLDYDALVATRILQIMNAGEVAEVARKGIDVQLHTHRHRTPIDAGLFTREIRDNRERIERITGTPAIHFCYPSGVHRPEFLPWLSSEHVVTATTGEPGLATTKSQPLLLPRIVDHSSLSDVEFEGWLSGFSTFLPRG